MDTLRFDLNPNKVQEISPGISQSINLSHPWYRLMTNVFDNHKRYFEEKCKTLTAELESLTGRWSAGSRASMESQGGVTRSNKTDRVKVMITAESVIAGFMIAYGALNLQMLVYWTEKEHVGSLVTTYLSGVLIYLVALTCLTSIILLHASLDTDSTEDARYKWGSWLFNWTILMTAIFVCLNVDSIYTFTKPPPLGHERVPQTWLPDASVDGMLIFFIFYGLAMGVIWLCATWAQKRQAKAGRLEQIQSAPP
jgi:hypothetical protein